MSSPPLDPRLQALLSSSCLWRAKQPESLPGSPSHAGSCGIASGHALLDAALPWRGWPRSALVEIISPVCGAGELQLVLPLLRGLSEEQQWSLWVAPPMSPYAPGLLGAGVNPAHNILVTPTPAQLLWTLEKALQSPACALVLGWPGLLSGKHVRRLQLAARKGQTLGILFHSRNIRHSPSALRLATQTRGDALKVQVLKARGSYGKDAFTIRLERP